MANNLINIKNHLHDFKDTKLSYSVSSRYIRPDIDIIDYLKIFYIYCDLKQIDSVFGNTSTFSHFYGGRPFHLPSSLTQAHLERMSDHGIGLALTLTNHYFDNAEYKKNLNFLKIYHKKGNSIICTNDQLALQIKNDFPDYEVKASIIKNINTIAKIEKALTIYDSLTLPMDKNDDDKFLSQIKEKNRIILFGNAGCAYTCPARTCYLGFSQKMTGRPETSSCSKPKIDRPNKGYVYFNVKKLLDMGFNRFKLIPTDRSRQQFARNFSNKKNYFTTTMKRKKGLYYICSYPKCGKTWLRYILVNYLNIKFDLNIHINLKSMFMVIPNHNGEIGRGADSYAYADDTRFPLLLTSHKRFNQNTFGENRIVFLLRSIPDVVVSDYFHVSKFLGIYKGCIEDYVKDPKGGLERYCQYLNEWVPELKKLSANIITYEMLHQNTASVIRDLLIFLNIPCNEIMIEKAVRHSSFSNMKNEVKKKGIPNKIYDYSDPKSRRMQKGVPKGFPYYLDRNTLIYMIKRCDSILNAKTRQFLNQYNNIAPDQIIQQTLEADVGFQGRRVLKEKSIVHPLERNPTQVNK